MPLCALSMLEAFARRLRTRMPSSGQVAVLRPLLKNTNLEFLPLRLAYDSAKHGWKASAWHSKVGTWPCSRLR